MKLVVAQVQGRLMGLKGSKSMFSFFLALVRQDRPAEDHEAAWGHAGGSLQARLRRADGPRRTGGSRVDLMLDAVPASSVSILFTRFTAL